jgi:signal transduction histidine kinase
MRPGIMKRKLTRLSRGYATALHKYLKQGRQASLLPARELGRRAAAIGLETLDVAKMHQTALAALEASSRRDGIIKQAELFFAEAITPIEETHRAEINANARLNQLRTKLGRRTVELVNSRQSLKRGIFRRKSVEQALKTSSGHYARLLKGSRLLQKRLRHLTRQLLLAQETKRTRLSRRLHDEIAQTLLGIKVRLLRLKNEATMNTKGFKKEIASTQRLVGKSAKTISRVTRGYGKQHGP